MLSWITGRLALRTRSGRLKNSFIPGGTLPTHPASSKKGTVTWWVYLAWPNTESYHNTSTRIYLLYYIVYLSSLLGSHLDFNTRPMRFTRPCAQIMLYYTQIWMLISVVSHPLSIQTILMAVLATPVRFRTELCVCVCDQGHTHTCMVL